MIFISWVIVFIAAIVFIQLPILPFRGMLKEVYQDLLEAWNKFLKIWNSFPAGLKSLYIILFILFSLGFFFYNYNYFNGLINEHFLTKAEANLGAESLSNIHRNIWLLFFAIFGVYLAIWARIVSQRQLEKSIQMNRNERFAKAAELLAKKNDEISSVGGFYMLRDLINESPKTEYIRCIEIISYWLFEYQKRRGDTVDIGDIVDIYLLNIVAKILKIRSDHEELENTIKEYKTENNLSYWPHLDTINLESAFLRFANLQGANLDEANLENVNLKDANLKNVGFKKARLKYAILKNMNLQGADLEGADLTNTDLQGSDLQGAALDGANLTNSDMRNTKGLTKEKIESAKWNLVFVDDNGNRNSDGKPPKLPDYLMKDDNLDEWLRKDSKGRVFIPKKSKAKKAKAKEPKN